MARSQSQVLTDHDEIRRWAEERNAAPSCVRGTGGKNDIGMLRLDFPGYSGQQSLEHIDWDEWFGKFDERGLALLVQERTARGERSNFNKLVSRETARAAGNGSRRSTSRTRSTARKSAGRTARKSSSAASQRKTAGKSGSARRSSGRSTARKSASSRSRSASAKSRSRSTSARSSSRSAGRKNVSRSNSSGSSRSRANARNSASTRSTSNRSRRSTASASSRRSTGSNRRGASDSARSGRTSSHVLVDHDEIRRWAEERNAEPACVRGTGGGDDPGMIRLDFPGYSGADSLERIDWDEWFRAFDENNLALVVQDTTAGGDRSNFNKLVARENAMAGSKRGSKSGGATARTRASEGNTGTKKAARGSNRAHRTESARGRTTSQRRAA